MRGRLQPDERDEPMGFGELLDQAALADTTAPADHEKARGFLSKEATQVFQLVGSTDE
jgi:hypothetical protein